MRRHSHAFHLGWQITCMTTESHCLKRLTMQFVLENLVERPPSYMNEGHAQLSLFCALCYPMLLNPSYTTSSAPSLQEIHFNALSFLFAA